MRVALQDFVAKERIAAERPLAVKLFLLALVWVGIGAVFALQLVYLGMESAANAFRFALLDWGPWIVISPAILWLSKRVQVSGTTWRWALPVHIAACCGVTVLLESGTHLAMENNWLQLQPPPGMGPPGAPPPEGGLRGDEIKEELPGNNRPPAPRRESSAMRQLMRARFTIPIYWVLVAAAHAVAYHRRSLERERRALQAEARLVEARLSALQAQLNPHFLFNTLNAITLYIHESPSAAEEMIDSLSEMLRVVLAASHRREVPLLEEFAFVDRYLAIQRVRFADRLTVKREISPDTLAATVPTLLLQPLVENAVIHGIAPESAPGTVFLRSWMKGGRLCIEVADTGHGVRATGTPLAMREGVGLGNTRARLQSLYGEDFTFSLTIAPEGGVCAHIELPMRTVGSST